jgi:branched-chain amino acid transport system ATP-binding protein
VLELTDVEVVYDGAFRVLHGLSLAVGAGEIVALLGPNGAGKSTALKAIAGLLPTERGEIVRGRVQLDGGDITSLRADQRVRRGVSLVMEGRRVFEHLTVHDNLVAGGYARRVAAADFERVYALLPRLADLRGRVAGYLSGGEQQMLAIGRALMARPRLLLLDEQNARRALAVAARGYVLESGRIALAGSAAELAGNPDVQQFYLGAGEAGHRRSYRDAGHRKRRTRWI